MHTSSNVLFLTDLAFNIRSGISWWTNVFFKLYGAIDKFGPSRLMKSMISDAGALKSCIDEILCFDIELLVVSHGDLLQDDAKTTLRQAFSFC